MHGYILSHLVHKNFVDIFSTSNNKLNVVGMRCLDGFFIFFESFLFWCYSAVQVFSKLFLYMYAVLGGVGVPSASDSAMLSCLHRFMNLNSMIISFLSPPSLLLVPPGFLDVLPHTASSGIIHIHILYFYTSDLTHSQHS